MRGSHPSSSLDHVTPFWCMHMTLLAILLYKVFRFHLKPYGTHHVGFQPVAHRPIVCYRIQFIRLPFLIHSYLLVRMPSYTYIHTDYWNQIHRSLP